MDFLCATDSKTRVSPRMVEKVERTGREKLSKAISLFFRATLVTTIADCSAKEKTLSFVDNTKVFAEENNICESFLMRKPTTAVLSPLTATERPLGLFFRHAPHSSNWIS